MKKLFLSLGFLALIGVSRAVPAQALGYNFNTKNIEDSVRFATGKRLTIGAGGTFRWDTGALFDGDTAAFREAIGVSPETFDGTYGSLTGKPPLGTSAALNVPAIAAANAAPTEVVRGDDPRLTDNRLPPSTAVTPGNYGSSTQVPVLTIGQDGRVTAAGTATISAGTGDASTNTASSIDGEGVEFHLTTGKLLRRSTKTGLIWENAGLRGVATVNAPIIFSGGTLFMAPATTSVPGYLTAADWTIFNAKQPLITAGTTGQYYRGDKTFVTLDKTAVGLPNVDNTADTAKPVSTAQQTALDLKAGLASDNDFTGKNSFTDYSRMPPAALATGTQTAAIGKHYTTTLTSNLTINALSGTLAADAKVVFELRGCNGTAVFDFIGFGTAKRNGATNVTSTSLTPTAGNHTVAFLYDLASTTWYYSDTVASPVNLAGGAASVTGILPVANGGSGTATPGIVAGTNVSVTGTWPNQTVNATAASYVAENARDDVGVSLTDSNTIDFTLNDGADTITADAKQQMSITSDASGLKLSGDASTPGNTKYYGTNGSGTKGWYGVPTEFLVAIGDETTALTTGTAKVTFRAPYALTLSEIRTSLTTASSSGLPTINIKEGGVTIFSTKPTIDASEKTSTTAATASVLSDTAIADDAEITIDVDVAGTGAAGLKVLFKGSR